MVQMYSIFGRQVGSHYLAMGVLGSLGLAVTMFTGGSKVQKTQLPPLNAKSPDEESFIKDFLANAESDGKGKAAEKK